VRWATLMLALLPMTLAPRADTIPAVAVAIEHGTVLPSHATARLRVTVEPQKANRGLWTAIEASGYAAAHYEQLEGAQAPKTRWTEFTDLPDGEYTAFVRVLREGKPEVGARATFIVGGGDEAFP
jgi:hypothetical protein